MYAQIFTEKLGKFNKEKIKLELVSDFKQKYVKAVVQQIVGTSKGMLNPSPAMDTLKFRLVAHNFHWKLDLFSTSWISRLENEQK